MGLELNELYYTTDKTFENTGISISKNYYDQNQPNGQIDNSMCFAYTKNPLHTHILTEKNCNRNNDTKIVTIDNNNYINPDFVQVYAGFSDRTQPYIQTYPAILSNSVLQRTAMCTEFDLQNFRFLVSFVMKKDFGMNTSQIECYENDVENYVGQGYYIVNLRLTPYYRYKNGNYATVQENISGSTESELSINTLLNTDNTIGYCCNNAYDFLALRPRAFIYNSYSDTTNSYFWNFTNLAGKNYISEPVSFDENNSSDETKKKEPTETEIGYCIFRHIIEQNSGKSEYNVYYLFKSVDKIKEYVSCYGVYFVTDIDYIQDENNSQNVYLGYMEQDGECPGKWIKGNEVATSNTANKNLHDFKDSPNTPNHINPNPSTDKTPLNIPTITSFNTSSTSYIINQTQLQNLMKWLWTADDTLLEQFTRVAKIKGENMLDAIISLRQYPFDLTQYVSVLSANANIQFTSIVCDKSVGDIVGNYNAIIDGGECVIFEKYENYLDYEPYTQCRMYIPYCAVVNLSMSQIVGKKLHLYYIVDLITNNCVAVLYADGIAVSYSSGIMGVDIFMTATDASRTITANTNIAVEGSKMMTKTTEMFSPKNEIKNNGGISVENVNNIPDIFSSAGKILDSYAHSAPSLEKSGVSSSWASFYQPQTPYLIISRTRVRTDGVAERYGLPCNRYTKLTDFTGFTVVDNFDTRGIPQATETEKQMIKSLFESGVII